MEENMAVQSIWWWPMVLTTNPGLPTSGSFVANIGLQPTVYAVATMSGLSFETENPEGTYFAVRGAAWVQDYTKKGVSQLSPKVVAGRQQAPGPVTPGIFDSDVDSVTFEWSRPEHHCHRVLHLPNLRLWIGVD
jgi:hypothetical protein